MISRYIVRVAAPVACTLLVWSIGSGASRAASMTVPAEPSVSTQSTVFVERVQPDATRRLEPADRLVRGDRVITMVNWRRVARSSSPFVITNPLPTALSYQASAWDDQDVSVDGGRTWGRLEALRVGRRFATPEDVTHVRWRISPAARTRGQIAYSGIVR
jgi:hypothetical protein